MISSAAKTALTQPPYDPSEPVAVGDKLETMKPSQRAEKSPVLVLYSENPCGAGIKIDVVIVDEPYSRRRSGVARDLDGVRPARWMGCSRSGIQSIERQWRAAHRYGKEISICGGVQLGAQHQPRACHGKQYDRKPENKAGPGVNP